MAKDTKTEVPKAEIVKMGTQTMASFDYGEDAVRAGSGPAKGFEHQTQHDSAIPFLVVLQPMSPVVSEGTLAGARAGMIMNTVTKQLWENPEGLLFVPATTRHEYIEFVPRDKGGGFKGKHPIDSDVVRRSLEHNKKNGLDYGEYYTDGGNELTETFSVFGAISDGNDSAGMAIFTFTSAKIKVYKNWISTVRAHTVPGPGGDKVCPPLYAHLVRITTEMKKNDKGVFHVPVIAPANGTIDKSLIAPNDPRFVMAKACKLLVDSGEAKVNYEQGVEGAGGKGKTDIPF